MIINRIDKEPAIQYAYLNIFPDQFKLETEKEDPSWVKNTMDYFANVGYAQYRKHRDTFVKNYDLMKGIIDYTHFYSESPETKTFADTLWGDTELPAYVKHYPILNPPVNTMVGEQSRRPDNQRVRAFDDDSKSEEMQYRSNLLEQLILQESRSQIYNKLASKGQDINALPEDQVEQLTIENVQEYLTDYTSVAERWGNHMLTALKARFAMKEKGEDSFRDLLITSREFFHIFEDNSKLGFNIEVLNPKNEWHLGTPDVKYLSGASGQSDTAYAAGSVHVMEISEIIEKFPDLTKEEVDHLRTSHQDYGLVSLRESNLYTNETGIESIKYDTYNKLVLQERMMVEAEMKENKDELKDWLGLTSNTASFGYKYTVVRAYWLSKKKIGELKYMDEEGNFLTTLVDETYEEGTPGEVEIKWGWVNQWYQGTRIGPDIYIIKPFKLLDYCPIIGVVHEIKNTQSKSLIDLMKPFQVLYNICMNQLYRLLEKEIGVVYKVQLRRIPTPKDGDPQDAIGVWEEEARHRGIVFEDDSPENLKAPISNTQTSSAIDLSRTNEIKTRYELAATLKNECWELVGMNRQRLGAPLATETATANQNALTQSFAQTEPYFVAHEYVLNQVYQALLDAAQHIESTKPLSTVSYVTAEAESAFIQVNSEDIKLKDLWVINTSNPEDQRLFNEMRQLSQSMLQNGATPYDIVNLYATNSMRQMKKIFKDLKDKQDQFAQTQQQLEQQQLEGQQQVEQAKIEQAERFHEDETALKKYDIDTKANTTIAAAEIKNYFQDAGADTNENGVPDAMEIANASIKQQEVLAKRDLENAKLSLELQKFQAEQKNKAEDIKIQREKIKNEKERNQIMKKTKAAQNKPKPKK